MCSKCYADSHRVLKTANTSIEYMSEDKASDKELATQCRSLRRRTFDPWVRTIPWRRAWQPTPVFMLENPLDRGMWWATVYRVTQGQT